MEWSRSGLLKTRSEIGGDQILNLRSTRTFLRTWQSRRSTKGYSSSSSLKRVKKQDYDNFFLFSFPFTFLYLYMNFFKLEKPEVVVVSLWISYVIEVDSLPKQRKLEILMWQQFLNIKKNFFFKRWRHKHGQ